MSLSGKSEKQIYLIRLGIGVFIIICIGVICCIQSSIQRHEVGSLLEELSNPLVPMNDDSSESSANLTSSEIEQRYIEHLAHLSDINLKVWEYRDLLLVRMGNETLLTDTSDLTDWEQDELTQWLREELDSGSKLERTNQLFAFTIDHDHYFKKYGDVLEEPLLTYFSLQESWESAMLTKPSFETLLNAINLIDNFKSQWETTLLGPRWSFLEKEFTRFVFYVMQDNIELTGELTLDEQALLKAFSSEHPTTLLASRLTTYYDLLDELSSHDEVIQTMVEQNLF